MWILMMEISWIWHSSIFLKIFRILSISCCFLWQFLSNFGLKFQIRKTFKVNYCIDINCTTMYLSLIKKIKSPSFFLSRYKRLKSVLDLARDGLKSFNFFISIISYCILYQAKLWRAKVTIFFKGGKNFARQ